MLILLNIKATLNEKQANKVPIMANINNIIIAHNGMFLYEITYNKNNKQ